jgi:hypothetical protein
MRTHPCSASPGYDAAPRREPHPRHAAGLQMNTSITTLRAVLAAVSIGAAAAPGHAVAGSTEGPDAAAQNTRRQKMASPKITPQQLVPLFAETIGSWQRVKVETPTKRPVPTAGPILKAEYRNGDARANLSISGTDAVASERFSAVDRETASGFEKLYKSGERIVREEFKREPRQASVSVTLANGLIVVASSKAVDNAALKQLVEGIDLARAEAIPRAAR